jgi:predicted PurR-regulated permease PerM
MLGKLKLPVHTKNLHLHKWHQWGYIKIGTPQGYIVKVLYSSFCHVHSVVLACYISFVFLVDSQRLICLLFELLSRSLKQIREVVAQGVYAIVVFRSVQSLASCMLANLSCSF